MQEATGQLQGLAPHPDSQPLDVAHPKRGAGGATASPVDNTGVRIGSRVSQTQGVSRFSDPQVKALGPGKTLSDAHSGRPSRHACAECSPGELRPHEATRQLPERQI